MNEIEKLSAINEWLKAIKTTDFHWLRKKHMNDDWEYVSEDRWQTFIDDADEVLYRLRSEASIQLRDAIHKANPRNKRLINGDEQ